jgi:hypothetical protein
MALPPLLRTRRYAQREIPNSTLTGGYGGAHYLLRELWATDDAAPIGSPRTWEPGPGSWTVTGSDQSISGGRYVFPSIVATQGLVVGTGLTRADGVAMVVRSFRVTSNPSATGLGFGFRSAASVGLSTDAGFTSTSADVKWSHAAGTGRLIPLLTTNTDYDFAVVLRSAGAFYLYKLSSASTWTLGTFNDQSTTTPLFPVIAHNASPGQCGPVSVIYPWTIPRAYYSASGVIGTVTLPISDFVAKVRCTGTGTVALRFRIQDANNYWRIERAATTFKLIETVAGVDQADRASQSITAATNDRIIVQAIGQVIRCWHNPAASATIITGSATAAGYASATNFQTATGMAVTDEANYSELEVFNSTQLGVAA